MIFQPDKPPQSHLQPSLPLIFAKHQPSHHESHKSLYKNDSESSHHTINPENTQLHLDKSLKHTLNPKHSFLSNDLQNSASIQKYLKKADQFNKFNAQKIFKIDSGLQENALKNYLYKIPKDLSIHRFPLDPDFQQKSNQKSLKKIYVSSKTKKSNSSRLDKISNRASKRFSTMSKMSQPQPLKKLVNQQVQTDKLKIVHKQKKSKPQKIPIKTSPRINTLELLEKSKTQKLKNQKSNLNMSKFINLSSILQKDEEEIQPPKKLNSIRHNHLQTKYLINQSFTGQQSTAPSTYTNTYLSSMSKLSSNFNSEVQKIKKNRYDFSEMSQKMSPQRYSRTIDVGSSNLQKNLDNSQGSPRNNDVQPELPKSVKSKNSSKQLSKNQQPKAKGHDIQIQVSQSQFNKIRVKSKVTEQSEEDKKVMSLSVVPQQSETMNSVNSQSGFEPFSALSIVNEEKQDNFNQANSKQIHKSHHKTQSTNNSKVKPKNHKKNQDQMMQFPEISELRISAMESYQENGQRKTIHPIRNNFNEKGISWITDSYRPKSKILDFINVESFVIKKYRNGVYFGQLEGEKKNGSGVIFYYNGKIYEGNFSNDLKEGEGYQQFPDGSKYQGQFKQGAKCGKGIFQWINGEVYEGEWFNGKKHGSGIWKSAEGESYIGEWNLGKAEGFGVYISKLGDRYEGEFVNSQKQGFGTERYHNGETYVGEYRRNRPNGQGEYFWINGNYYKGEFVNHLRHGEGYFKDVRTGEEYKGEYRNDKKCGYGELKHGNINYVGNFENDYKHGYGEFYEDEECKYKGYWVNGKFLDEEEEEHEENCPQNKNKFQTISEKPELEPSKNNARVNRIKTINNQKIQGRSSLGKSRSPINHNKSIENLENENLQNSNYKRSCGCARKH